ncbi:MAG TPA: pentapeptide repeat-containing protein [Galbitalea sp.]
MAVIKDSRTPRVSFDLPQGLIEGDALTLEDHEAREGERFPAVDLTGRDLSGANFLECVLESTTLTDTGLRGTRFVDSALIDAFATSLVAARSSWRGSLIQNPRWGSAELFDSVLENVQVIGGKIDFLNLRGAKLSDVLIEGATITELDLGGVTATRLAIRNCRIETIDFTRANCTAVDLRESTFARVNGIEGMRGTILSEVQLADLAPVLAAQLGIEIA